MYVPGTLILGGISLKAKGIFIYRAYGQYCLSVFIHTSTDPNPNLSLRVFNAALLYYSSFVWHAASTCAERCSFTLT